MYGMFDAIDEQRPAVSNPSPRGNFQFATG
jgi:hypothetical protein